MSYREYLRLEHAQAAGDLVRLPSGREFHTVFDCDNCGREIGRDVCWHGRVDLQPARSAGVCANLDLCARCVASFPPGILAKLAEYGLELPGADGKTMTPT